MTWAALPWLFKLGLLLGAYLALLERTVTTRQN